MVLKPNTAVSTSGAADAWPVPCTVRREADEPHPGGLDRGGRTGSGERQAESGPAEQQCAECHGEHRSPGDV